jgi:hypothetical protein
MIAEEFHSGERVRVRAGVPFLLAGTLGTILYRFVSVDDTYKVQLDGQSYARVMSASDLVYRDFELGDRIKASIASPLVHVGTLGTIGFLYPSVPDAYEVYFDGHLLPILMRARELERVAAPPTSLIAPGPHS